MIEAVDLLQRVRSLAASAGNLAEVRTGLDRALRAGIGYDIASIATVDPATMLWTSCYSSGLPPGGEAERERILYDIEFNGGDINSYTDLFASGALVGRLHHATGGDLTRAQRWEALLRGLGIIDELRAVLVSGDMAWASLTLYRVAPREPFDDGDETVVRRALRAMADLFRLAMLRAAIDTPSGLDDPPGMLLVAPDGRVSALSAAAQRWLDAIDDRHRIPSIVRSVAAAAAAGDSLAHAAVPTADGRWVMLHAAPLTGHDTGMGIIIEEARPAEVSDVIARAYGLTPREREVTALAAQGRSTKQIAHDLEISPFTVQDHLKAVFAKIGVQSRAELVATLYVRHYEPRRRQGATPSPYGWYLDDHAAAV